MEWIPKPRFLARSYEAFSQPRADDYLFYLILIICIGMVFQRA